MTTTRLKGALRTTLLCLAAGVLGLGVLASVWLYFHHHAATGTVGKALAHELEYEARRPIVVARLTPFAWDELFLFGPYHPRDLVCNCLQLAEPRCSLTVADGGVDDSEMLLVFRRDKAVVHSEKHFRINGDFTGGGAIVLPLTPATAVFDVELAGRSVAGLPWRMLMLHDGPNVASSVPFPNRPCGET